MRMPHNRSLGNKKQKKPNEPTPIGFFTFNKEVIWRDFSIRSFITRKMNLTID
jgi:hypothetical protein